MNSSSSRGLIRPRIFRIACLSGEALAIGAGRAADTRRRLTTIIVATALFDVHGARQRFRAVRAAAELLHAANPRQGLSAVIVAIARVNAVGNANSAEDLATAFVGDQRRRRREKYRRQQGREQLLIEHVNFLYEAVPIPFQAPCRWRRSAAIAGFRRGEPIGRFRPACRVGSASRPAGL